MIESIVEMALPVDEILRIRKNHIVPEKSDCGKRISIVTGIHGDEMEGQYVCYEVNRRIQEHKDWLLPMAAELNTDFIWIHSNATVLQSTLAYSLNSTGTPTLVVEMGVGMRITKSIGKQLTDGIVFFLYTDPLVYAKTAVIKVIPEKSI